MNKKIISITVVTLFAIFSGYFMMNISQKSTSKKISDQQKVSKERKKRKIDTAKKRYAKKNIRTKRDEWKDVTNYKHKDKIIKHFQRFRRRNQASKDKTPPEINLKLGKLVTKKQKNREFNIREILVSIEGKKGPKTFVALVNEKTGRIIQKQGRRIRDPLSRISERIRRGRFEK